MYKNHQFFDSAINPLIVNDNAELIYEVKFTENQSIFVFNNERSHIYNSSLIPFVIDKDRIYYLDPYNIVGDKYEDEDYVTIQEYELTINNGKIKTNALNTYKGSIEGEY